jgi:Fe-S-cluster-containing dehydrogenase component
MNVGISRRAALKGMLAGTAAVAGATATSAAVLPQAAPDAVGLLYDATLCIGCKACVAACQEANGLSPDPTGLGPMYNAPVDLSQRAKTVIKLYVEGNQQSFMKAQCNHCIDPACTTACMLGALKKRELGIVTYEPDLCVGCRYCEVACPFGVPKFEWAKAAPKIVKCELCKDRLKVGLEPACTAVCPRDAVIFGKRTDLLREAKRRIAAEPDRYFPKVYGETEGGGTQVLYLSHVPFDKLGLPALGDTPAPVLARSIQHGVYRGFIAPVALYGVLGLVMWRSRRNVGPSFGSGAGEAPDESSR